jgi:hypothetical protein
MRLIVNTKRAYYLTIKAAVVVILYNLTLTYLIYYFTLAITEALAIYNSSSNTLLPKPTLYKQAI